MERQGEFCWAELMTTDVAAARKFYGDVFGWQFEAQSHGMPYFMIQGDGGNIGGLYELGEGQKQMMGARSNWLPYIAVDDADKSLDAVKQAGGTVRMGPMDVFDFGRMGLIQEPSGAMVALWQEKQARGTLLRNQDNTICWHELLTTDIDSAGGFFASVIGWNLAAMPMDGMTYHVAKVGETEVAGLMQMPEKLGSHPSCWSLYIQVADISGAIEKIKTAGGTIEDGPADSSYGPFAVVRDPQNAVFCIIEPAQ